MDVGTLIREARDRLGWTQTQLADRVGATPSFVAKVENNKSLPSYERLLAFANLLVLDSEQLLSLIEKQRRQQSSSRVHTRGVVARRNYGVQAGITPDRERPGTSDLPSAAELLRREILEGADLRAAFTFLRAALADPELKPAVLKTLETFAKQAKPFNSSG
jgi:transcriptional regulator with XRE-family HTH domain